MQNNHSPINIELINRIKYLQKALYQAETIIHTLEKENQRLHDVLISLASNNEGYVLDSEAFNEPVCSV